MQSEEAPASSSLLTKETVIWQMCLSSRILLGFWWRLLSTTMANTCTSALASMWWSLDSCCLFWFLSTSAGSKCESHIPSFPHTAAPVRVCDTVCTALPSQQKGSQGCHTACPRHGQWARNERFFLLIECSRAMLGAVCHPRRHTTLS